MKEHIVPPYNVKGYEQTDSFTDANEADRKVLRQLVEMGCDLENPRHSIHYFYFDSELGSLAAADELVAMAFNVQVGEQVATEPASRRWPVTGDRTEVINEGVIFALREPLTAIAGRHGGEYDGWEAACDS